MARVVCCSHPLAQGRRETLDEPVQDGDTLAAYLGRLGLPVKDLVAGVFVNGLQVPRAELVVGGGRIIEGDYVAVVPHAGDDNSNPLAIVLTIALAAVTFGASVPLATSSLLAGFGAAAPYVAGGIIAAVNIAGQFIIQALLPPRQQALETAGRNPTYSLSGARNRARPYEPMLVVLGKHRIIADLGGQPYTEYRDDEQFFLGAYHFGLGEVELEDFKIGDTPIDSYEDVEVEQSSSAGRLNSLYENVDTVAGAVLDTKDVWLERTTSERTNRIEVDFDANLFRLSSSGNLRSAEITIEGQFRRVGTTTWNDLLLADLGVPAAWYWSLGRNVSRYDPTTRITSPVWQEIDRDLPDPELHDNDELIGANGSSYYRRGQWNYVQTGTQFGGDLGDQLVFGWRWTDAAGADLSKPIRPRVNYDVNPADAAGLPGYRWVRQVVTAETLERFPALVNVLTVSSYTLRSDSTDVLRRTFFRDVPDGQYEVRVRRTSTPPGSGSSTTANLTWTVLRSFQSEVAGDFNGQKRVALRIRATGQINGAVDRLNAIAYQLIPSGPDAFVADTGARANIGRSSNPAAVYLHVLRGRVRYTAGMPYYGIGMRDANIDLEGLLRWHQWCEDKNLECNLVVTSAITQFDLLTTIAQCGRAVPSWHSGKLGVIFDQADQPALAVFGMPNIVAGSFRVTYVSDDLADEIVAQYTDEDEGYERRELRVQAPDVDVPQRSVTMDLAGVTNRDQAGREAALMIARQFYHRRRIQFATDLEGWACEVGDVVHLSHDLTSWGRSGRLTGILRATPTPPFLGGGIIAALTATGVMLDRAIVLDDSQHYVTLRSAGGDVRTFSVAERDMETDTLNFVSPSQWIISNMAEPQDVVYVMAPEPTPGKLAKIVSMVPRSDLTIDVSAIDEVAEYYEFETTGVLAPPPLDYTGRLAEILAITFTEELVDLTGRVTVVAAIEARNTSVATARYRVNRGRWVSQPLLSDRSIRIEAHEGDTIEVTAWPSAVVKVRDGLDQRRGSLTATHVVVGYGEPPPDVTGFSAARNGNDGIFSWAPVEVEDFAYYEIREGTDWDTAHVIGRTMDTTLTRRLAAEGTYLIRAFDLGGRRSANAVSATLGPVVLGGYGVQLNEHTNGWTGFKNNVAVLDDYQGGALQSDKIVVLGTGSGVDNTGVGLGYMPAGTNTRGYVQSRSIDLGEEREFTFVSRYVERAFFATDGPWIDLGDPWTSAFVSGAGWDSDRADNSLRETALEMRFADDAGVWTAWEPYYQHTRMARYAQSRVVFTGEGDPAISNVLEELTLWASFEPREYRYDNASIPVSGRTFTYAQPFSFNSSVQITVQGGNPGDVPHITAKTNSAVTIRIVNVSGTPVAGEASVIVTGA